MVSFQCDGCADTVKKPQLDKHRQRCWASFTCLDCSTTFQNQDYKSHTSCISEAEKYQGALYKGPKKGHQGNNNAKNGSYAPSPAASVSSPAPEASAGAAAAPSGIHPSRLNQVTNANAGSSSSPRDNYQHYPPQSSRGGYARGGFGGRGGRGGFGGNVRTSATGENRSVPQGGMRSWGSSAPPSESGAESPAPPPPAASTLSAGAGAESDAKKNKKKKKGDKGGTGSKANSRVNGEAEAEAEAAGGAKTKSEEVEPKNKKRKREEPVVEATTETTNELVSDKTIKRVRKQLGKMESTSILSLNEWIDEFAKSSGGGKKDKAPIDRAEVLAALKVEFVDGKWQILA